MCKAHTYSDASMCITRGKTATRCLKTPLRRTVRSNLSHVGAASKRSHTKGIKESNT